MPADYPRSHRVADFIQRELTDLLRSEMKDPRVSTMVTVSSVEVSRDLGTAKVHYTVMGAQPGEREETHKALTNAAGFLRRKLAPRLNTRSVPQLRFYYDDSIEHGAHMSALIADAVATNTTESNDSSESGSEPGSELTSAINPVAAAAAASQEPTSSDASKEPTFSPSTASQDTSNNLSTDDPT